MGHGTSREDNDNNNESKENISDDNVTVDDATNSEKDIVKRIWEELTGENILSRLTSPTEHKAANAWAKLCHRCDVSYPSSKELKVIDMFDNQNMMMFNQIRYSLRHAVAAYPPQYLLLLGVIGPSKFQMDTFGSNAFKTLRGILNSSFKIPAHDLILDNISNKLLTPGKLYDPAFYLAVDRAHKLIVLSIRGTVSLSDALADIDAIAEAHTGYDVDGDGVIDGYVHPGILRSAQSVMKKVNDELISLCNKFKDFQVIFTGHSLGAGVAAMLGFLYFDHPIICKQHRLHCFAFASPCVVSREFTEKQIGLNYITSIALSTDMVTRLSVESVKKMNVRLDIIRKYLKENKGIIKQCLDNVSDESIGSDDGDDNEQKEQEKWCQLVRELKDTPTPNPKQQLFPLGKILWFVPKEIMVESDEQRRENLLRAHKGGYNWNNGGNINEQQLGNGGMGEVIAETLKNMAVKSGFKRKAGNKYDGSNYILCEASNCRDMFQEFVQDMPESLYAHYPTRYMLACYTKL